MSLLQTRLRSLSPAIVANLRRGIEKESLRVRPDGALVTTPHPKALGAALTHPHITTDFSEAQLEFITGVHSTAAACLDELKQIHQFVYRHIGDEVLWCGSMPCSLPEEKAIPLAGYGHSNVGRAKTLYRMGLSHRYGRRMQLISGIHYNFSLSEDSWPLADFRDVNDAYFALIRNFRRHAWLLLYVFGASPAVCASFVEGRAHDLQELAPGTLYLPHATSLRMGRLGYLSAAQDALAVSHNDLASYAASLEDALTKPYPAYEKIGIRDGEDYRQLATSLLQIENEFYSTIRPKRVVRTGERPLRALRERGVQYVEVRAMDLDPFCAIGITSPTVRFLDVFLLHCLLHESPPDTPQEIAAIGRNKQRVAGRGREPGLRLDRGNDSVELRVWAGHLLAECEPIASALDAAHGGSEYRDALLVATRNAAEPESLPSARVLSAMRQHYGGSYFRFALEQSLRHRSTLLGEPLSEELESKFRRLADESLDEQQMVEANDDVPFETFLQQYLSTDSLRAR
jgi:glutamate--cysteine ligase